MMMEVRYCSNHRQTMEPCRCSPKAHSKPMSEHCRDWHKAEMDGDGWSIDWSPCVLVVLVESKGVE